jgi:hypothetical protein
VEERSEEGRGGGFRALGGRKGDATGRDRIDPAAWSGGPAGDTLIRGRARGDGEGQGVMAFLIRRGLVRSPGSVLRVREGEQGRSVMGDKGKKAKDKGQKQSASKHDQEAKKKLDKQPKKTP